MVEIAARPAYAKRVALVIGNADYKVGLLQNPVNDAAAVAEAFGKLGFDKVILRKNLGVEGFRAALLEMSRESIGAEVATVFFAGHGTEVNGRNFLLPVDATLARASALDLEAISLDAVLSQLDGVRKLKLILLDACRNNVFPMAGGKRTVSRGLARIEPEDNTLVVYAAKDGTTADDRVGRRHSPFTEALLKHIATPGLEVTLLFRRVRDDVKATSHAPRSQQPHTYASLRGQEFYLLPPAPPTPTLVPAARPQLSEVERTWAAVKDSPNISALEAFRRQHGPANPVYERLAEARIAELRRQQLPVAVVSPAPALTPEMPSSGESDYQPRVGQPGKDVVWVPTAQSLVERMLDMAKVTPNDYVIDLGSGDGRLVISAAKRGAKALGIEYDQDLVELSKRNAAKTGVSDKASFVRADLFESDFSQATVLTLFLLIDLNIRLRPTILNMAPGTRVLSNSFGMGDWIPDSSEQATPCKAHLWIVPAKVGGHVETGTERACAASAVPDDHWQAHERQCHLPDHSW